MTSNIARRRENAVLVPLEKQFLAYLERHGGLGSEIGRIDSRIIGEEIGEGDVGDLIQELIGDEDYMGLIGDDDIGEVGRRQRQRRVQRVAQRHGMVAVPRERVAQALRSAKQERAQLADVQTEMDGRPRSAGRFLAASDQYELYLPFSAAVTLAAAINSTANLTANVQKPIQVRRVILSAMDQVAFTDALVTVGVTGISVGVDPIFVAQGTSPGQAFAFNAVGARLLAYAAQVGNNLTVALTRPFAVTNATTVMGYAVGVAAARG